MLKYHTPHLDPTPTHTDNSTIYNNTTQPHTIGDGSCTSAVAYLHSFDHAFGFQEERWRGRCIKYHSARRIAACFHRETRSTRLAATPSMVESLSQNAQWEMRGAERA